MLSVTLPDGSVRSYEQPLTIQEVAADIGPGLAKATIAGEIAGVLVDLSTVIDRDIELRLITDRDPAALEVIRHSTAHLMAQAVKDLFPETLVTIGPVIEDGFYYDFSRDESFTPDDMIAIEQRMQVLAAKDLPLERSLMGRDEAAAYFHNLGEHYKEEIIADIPSDQQLSFYRQGDFIDLCRGPHVPSTGKLAAFKLMKLAGAYWRGDSNRPMLQRIYGTAWTNKKELKAYLHRLQEAEKRDHRRLGRQMDLFHTQEEAPGMIFWHDNGWIIYQQVEQYIRQVLRQNGYQEVKTPQVVDRSLWERSGHWDKFGDMMFTTQSENRDYAIKPMNCPCHIQIYNHGIKSYRDLPLRMAEFGSCHRNEPSGTLHGLMRVRNFVQDDAHIFCSEKQIQSEVATFNQLLFQVYRDFGFEDVIIKLSTRPEQRVGSDEVWDRAEKALEEALEKSGLEWALQPGEGAFYGPKLEFSLRDSIGRVWQCGTIQVDFSMPGRLGAEFVDEAGERQTPVMLHRAILGSLERFIGILIENYAGTFTLWLAPVQAVVLTITDRQHDFAKEVTATLIKQTIRAKSDLRNEKIGFKIREHTLNRTPYQLIIGDREVETRTVTVRSRNGKDLGSFTVDELITKFNREITRRGVPESEE
ncbi:MAG: threonine--tRNA ligase [Gammaproteobacteria bacterium]|nr:threonine--tRNA ligase [Gammaproteobacteria bacterium]